MQSHDSVETEQLIPPTSGDDEAVEAIAPRECESRRGDSLAALVSVCSLLAVVIYTWNLVFTSNPAQLGYFAVHPPAQTLSVLALFIGALQLQPTQQSMSKIRGLARHQLIMLGIGAPAILVGGGFMMWNKVDHGAPHFTSWHGKFGLISLIWLCTHILFGGSTVWFDGKAFGGQAEAKKFWKWHRLSGYLLLSFLLITIHLSGTYADWAITHTSSAWRVWIYTIFPILALGGLFARMRTEKLPNFQR